MYKHKVFQTTNTPNNHSNRTTSLNEDNELKCTTGTYYSSGLIFEPSINWNNCIYPGNKLGHLHLNGTKSIKFIVCVAVPLFSIAQQSVAYRFNWTLRLFWVIYVIAEEMKAVGGEPLTAKWLTKSL
ncbi:hypothetical protein TNCT_250701 [Trichonephila clavata]|uniref:Uncharacterized protein n=1 Tax=Trichonephila clavata TaxID=2740835 RepID=A0A8X6H4T7_TRICU|nr:hypothetical protein TNCT_250701 [Trichonephila clavata]